jgi:hypothetical protein
MKNKSIISLISFFLLSMFYVASANAGPTYVNVEVPKECGTWKVLTYPQHCMISGPSSGKAGKATIIKCVGGGNGKGGVGIETQRCGVIILSTADKRCPGCGAMPRPSFKPRDGRTKPIYDKFSTGLEG